MTTPRTTHLLVRALDTNRDVTKVDLMLTVIVVRPLLSKSYCIKVTANIGALIACSHHLFTFRQVFDPACPPTSSL